MSVKKLEEIWSVKYSRIDDYLSSVCTGLSPDGKYMFPGCTVFAEMMPEKHLGSLCFPRTKVIFEGGQDAVERIHDDFFMEFLSGGA